MAAIVVAATGSGSALAGPPFLTDDPEPVEYQHWELYLFSTLDKTKDGTTVLTPAMEINYGLAPDLQAHAVVPMTMFLPSAGGTRAYGLGDIELGLKYRFVQETETVPMVGVFPLIEVASGDADRGLGNGRTWARFPIWAQKSWGDWTLLGGGGYEYNTARGQLSNFYGGTCLQRNVSEKLILGAEVFAHGPDHSGGRTTVLGNVGGYYKVTEDFQLLFSVGHSLSGDRDIIAYVGLYWTWGPGSKDARAATW